MPLDREYFAAAIKTLNQKFGFIDTSERVDRLSSGLLSFDYVLNGGFSSGFTVMSGLEGSGKSTASTHVLGSAVQMVLPVCKFFDAEGSLHPTYSGAIFRGMNVVSPDEIFNDGRVDYTNDNGFERIINWLVEIMGKMPDKMWHPKADSWVYRMPKRGGPADALGLKIDKKLTSDKWVYSPTDYSGPEGAVIIDSLTSMMTEETEEEGPNNRMGGAASQAYSKHLPRITKLSRKGIILVGTSQIRLKPGVMYGSPEYEPGGEALKHYTSVRNRVYKRASPQDMRDKETGQAVEPSIHEGHTDFYQHAEMINDKNKFGRPKLRCKYRVWSADYKGNARGIDIVYDTAEYLRLTGQAAFNPRTKIKFDFRDSMDAKIKSRFHKKTMSWSDFKVLVLATSKTESFARQSIAKKYKGKIPNIRGACFAQLKKDKSLYETRAFVAEKEEDLEA